MEVLEKYLPRIIRISVFLLFIISGTAKMFPIWFFEKQLVDLGIATWCTAPYFARILIALEIVIGIAILQPHHLKKLVIPTAIFLLTIFCVHLAVEMYKHGALNGNCGCFGQLIEMSPLAAFIKNIIMLAALIYLFRSLPESEKENQKSIYLILTFLASLLLMFVAFPFQPCRNEVIRERGTASTDSSQKKISVPSVLADTSLVEKSNKVKLVVSAPEKKHSRFSDFTTFGSKRVNFDEGKKIICLFAAGCDHCKEAAKEMVAFSKKEKFHGIYILFMDEETHLIPDFIKQTGCEFPYQVIDVSKFWQAMGENGNTPGIFYLWNGNIIKFYEGTEKNKFDLQSLQSIFDSPYN